jgi:hypothetical protein
MRRGRVRISATTSVFWVLAENPVASRERCALLRAGETIELRIPVNCSRLAVLAVSEPGTVTITEVPGARSSCSL